MPTRRHALALLSAAPFAASCGSHAPDPAAGWRDPGAGEIDPRRFALAHAILAPNPHNTQPWQVAFDGDQGMTLWCDPDRKLGFTDPYDRQLTLGFGAFMYLYWIALVQRGFVCQFEMFPEGSPDGRGQLDSRPVAHVRMISPTVPETGPALYFEQITQRRTNRNPYDTRVPGAETLDAVAHAALDWQQSTSLTSQVELAPERVEAFRDLVWRAFDRELRTRGAQIETYKWLRFGRGEMAEHRDGLLIDVPMAPLLKAAGILSLDLFLDPDSTANKDAAADWKEKADTAPAFMWLATEDDTPVSRLLAGMAYARMNLAATAAGIAIHPWSQALQEYEEMADLYAEARTLLGAGDRTVQMLVRAGYAAPVDASARRDAVAFVRA